MSRVRSRWARGLGVVIVLALAPAARAQAPADDEALALYRQSEESYKAGRYQDAADLLRRAYELKPEPAFLFNMGRAYERAGDLSHAIDAYARYLQAQPGAPNRADVTRTITTMRRQQQELEALVRRHDAEIEDLKREQARERAHSAETTRGAILLLPKVIVGVGAAGLVAGGVLGGLALNRQSAAEAEPKGLPAADELNSARRFATASTAAFITGGALLVTGVVWWVIASRRTPSAEAGARPLRTSN